MSERKVLITEELHITKNNHHFYAEKERIIVSDNVRVLTLEQVRKLVSLGQNLEALKAIDTYERKTDFYAAYRAECNDEILEATKEYDAFENELFK